MLLVLLKTKAKTKVYLEYTAKKCTQKKMLKFEFISLIKPSKQHSRS